VLVGIDEETALVGTGDKFTVRGKKSVWRIDRDGTRLQFRPGERLKLAATTPQ
jgi:hypothetical protein